MGNMYEELVEVLAVACCLVACGFAAALGTWALLSTL
jgi:hypothetical protein